MTEQRARELLAAEQDSVGLHASAMLVRSGKPSLSDLAAIRAITTALSTNDGEKYRLMLLDLLAVIHRDGGHRTQELGIKLSYEQALQLSSERQFAESAKSPSDSVREALERIAGSWTQFSDEPGNALASGYKTQRDMMQQIARAALQSSEADNPVVKQSLTTEVAERVKEATARELSNWLYAQPNDEADEAFDDLCPRDRMRFYEAADAIRSLDITRMDSDG